MKSCFLQTVPPFKGKISPVHALLDVMLPNNTEKKKEYSCYSFIPIVTDYSSTEVPLSSFWELWKSQVQRMCFITWKHHLQPNASWWCLFSFTCFSVYTQTDVQTLWLAAEPRHLFDFTNVERKWRASRNTAAWALNSLISRDWNYTLYMWPVFHCQNKDQYWTRLEDVPLTHLNTNISLSLFH